MKNQAKRLLCNLRNGHDLLFAEYCEEKGEARVFSDHDIKVGGTCWCDHKALMFDDDGQLRLSQFALQRLIARAEKKLDDCEVKVGVRGVCEAQIRREKEACKQLIRDGKRSEAAARMKKLNQTLLKEKENAQNHVVALRGQLETLMQTDSVKQLYKMKKMTYEAMPAASMSVEEVENLMDDVADRQKDMEEIQNRMMETVEQENVDDVLKEVDEAIVNEALPAPPVQPVAEEPACAYEGLLTNTPPRLRLPSLHHANHLVDRRAAALIIPALQDQLLHFYISFPLLYTTIGNRLPNHRLLASFHSLNQLRVRTPLQTHVAHVRDARSVPARPLAHHLVNDAPERVHVHLRRARLVAQQLRRHATAHARPQLAHVRRAHGAGFDGAIRVQLSRQAEIGQHGVSVEEENVAKLRSQQEADATLMSRCT